VKILCFIPNPDDGTSFYRGQGVLNEIHKTDPAIQISYANINNNFKFMDAKGFDIAFFQRPDLEPFKVAIKMLKNLGIKIILDYDDYLLKVPLNNRYHKLMSQSDTPYESNVIECLQLADLVTVSTDKLKECFSNYNNNIIVIRNAFDDYCFKPCESLSKKKVVVWRGGATHQPDFNHYGDEVYKLIKNNPDFTFIFWTEMFRRRENSAFSSIAQLLFKLPNFELKNPTSPIDYLQ
jgi:hypothetical protein